MPAIPADPERLRRGIIRHTSRRHVPTASAKTLLVLAEPARTEDGKAVSGRSGLALEWDGSADFGVRNLAQRAEDKQVEPNSSILLSSIG
jgi:hypothetical protein